MNCEHCPQHDAPEDAQRRALVLTTGVVGGAGLAAAAVPFVASLAPSERSMALSAPVEVDIASLKAGELRVVAWRGRPVFLLHRTPAMIESLRRHDDLLADPRSRRSIQPEFARGPLRSARPDIAVIEAVCTHLGCVPTFRPEAGAPDIGANWPGGFFCPCHGSKFDFAGRVFNNVPAPTNLTIPPYRFAAATTIVIGDGKA